MITDVASFDRRLLGGQALVGVATFTAVAVFAPRLVLLDVELTSRTLRVGAALVFAALALTAASGARLVRTHHRLVRAVAASAHVLDPRDLERFAHLPRALTLRFVIASSAVSALVLVPGVRPSVIDMGRAVSLFILTVTLLAAASIPQYVLARSTTLVLFEACPIEPLASLLGSLEARGLPWRRVIERMLLAVVVPVALMSVGALLVAHAHLRTFTEDTRRMTALFVAESALEPLPGPNGAAGREAARLAAAALGFDASFDPTPASDVPTFSREDDGRLAARATVDDGRVTVRFRAGVGRIALTGGLAVGLLSVLVAAALGAFFGRALADDLVQATKSVRALGTDSVMRGGTRLAKPARFAIVAELGRAIEGLTERFRVFAAAQERALDARLSAQRVRGQLFASVSHDLRSPLNAILGFAELLSNESLTPAQRESLELITRRGRELLALIETILDAARVEAGQLDLAPKPIDVATLLEIATEKAKDLVGRDAPLLVRVAEDLPDVPVDPVYGAHALAVVFAHALGTAEHPAHGAEVRAIADGDAIRFDVHYGDDGPTADELDALFSRKSARGRGLALGLSLARSVIELHGGSLEVDGSSRGAPVCHVRLKLVAPTARPMLSSAPALG